MFEIFDEECQVYIDRIEEGKYLIEIHFEDCNFYEIEFGIEDTKDEIITKIQKYLVRERVRDKQDTSINGNNRRYFQKELSRLPEK